jgi:hypothetical protein
MTFRTLRTMNLFENFDLIIIIFASFKFGSVRFEIFGKLHRFGSVRFENISVRFGSV